MATSQTPVRSIGSRTEEGWILLRDAGSEYRDGAEQELLALLHDAADLSTESDELVVQADTWAKRYHLDPDRANLLRGLAIPSQARVLEVGAGCGAITRYLGEVAGTVDAVEPVAARARVARARCRDLESVEVFVGEIDDVPVDPVYDVVVVVGVLEYVGAGAREREPYLRFLRAVEQRLAPGGTLVLAIENALGVKYFAGAPEDHTNRVFDSLENYPYGGHARTFSRAELEALVRDAGLRPRTLGVFPDYKMTRVVMDTEALATPPHGLVAQLPGFPSPDHLTQRVRLVDEGSLWRTACRAGLAGELPNSFLVLAGKDDTARLWPDDQLAMYHSTGRRRAFRMTSTVQIRDGATEIVRRPRASAVNGEMTLVASTEPVVEGVDFLDWAAAADDELLGTALRAWVRMVREREEQDGRVSPDLVPHNLMVTPSTELVVVDQEWAASVDGDRAVQRGLFWLAARLSQRVPPTRWSVATVGELAAHLAALAEVAVAPDWLTALVHEEARIQAAVQLPSSAGTTDEFIAACERDLAEVLGTTLESAPLGRRAPELVSALQAELDAAGRDRERALQDVVRTQRALEDERERRLGLEERLVETSEQLGKTRAALEAADVALRSGAETLRVIENSRSWRVVRRYYGAVDRLAPAGTARRRAYGATGRLALSTARTVLRRPGAGVPTTRSVPLTPIALPTSDTPVVSVVIPVHGKWDVTEACLRSFLAHPPTVTFEVVVVDDASPDDTRAHLQQVAGVRTVLLDQNRGFVGAVNAGIEACRGEYVVMLNNDTEITDGWLEALLEQGARPDVGLVGSRLVYPNGLLQEAGGIIFSNGGGWNWGRLDNPHLERYGHVRDVDYCSGAAIMLRRDLLAEIGNLDEEFAPAYYDDVDLAFSVRERGLRVVYQPKAVVVHKEGVSHGTDTATGVKAYQEINREKLLRKWGHRLADHYPQQEVLVPAAARRHDGRGTIVVIDHHVPRPDEDSGSVRMFALLTTLRRAGWSVVFIPDNRDRGAEWGERLMAEGVELFIGPEHPEHFLSAIRDRVKLVIGARVHVAWPYMSTVRRALPGVPFVFDTVDLHYIREQREAELSGDREAMVSAMATRGLELAMVATTEATIVVSPVEKAILAEASPGADVHVVPNVHVPHGPAAPSGRAGALFVGSFAHPPNADAVQWFVDEVLPLVREEIPDFRLSVVGKGAPENLRAAAGQGVDILGWLPTLDDVYARARVSVAPLRYGAGIKGKVGEAMSHGVPVVVTSVAGEGMRIEHGVQGWVADDPRGFARGIVELSRDDALWTRISEAGQQHVEQTLGVAQFEQSLGRLIDGVVVD